MRKKNFFAGPSVLPLEVLEKIRDQIVGLWIMTKKGFP